MNHRVMVFLINFFRAPNDKFKCMEPDPPFFAGSRSRPNVTGVASGTTDFRSRQKNDGSTTLVSILIYGAVQF